jgi:ribosome maturation protein Sdo1
MFYNFANNPKVPSLDFSNATIQDSTNFSTMMEANSKREKIVGLIASINQNPGTPVNDTALKSAIEDLSASIDLVRNREFSNN